MAEHLRFVDATNGSPYYDSAAFAQVEEVKADGVAYGYLNKLEVIQYGALQVKVKDGAMVSKGRTYIQDEPSDGASPRILTLEAAQAGYLRKDMIVVEFDLQNCLGAAKIIKGVEDLTDPELPNLTDEPNLWQVCLAIVDVDDTAIINIEDKRVIGNRRTCPVFSEDISAPNIRVNDNGKLYLNDGDSAYLRFSDNGLKLKVPNRDETKMIGGLVAEVVLDADASSIVINNLDINADGGTYEFCISGQSTLIVHTELLINNDVTGSNYYSEWIRGNGSTILAYRNNLPYIGAFSDSQSCIDGTIYLNPVSGHAVMQSSCALRASSNVEKRIYGVSSVNTFTNITKLTLTQADNFKVGTTLKIFKR